MDSHFISLQIRLPNVLFLATTLYISVTGTEDGARNISQAPDLWMTTASASHSMSHSLIPHDADISLPVHGQPGDKSTVPSRRAAAEEMADHSLGKMTREAETEPATNVTLQDGQWSVPAPGLGDQVKVGDYPTSTLEMSNDAGTLMTTSASSKKNITLPDQSAELITPERHPAQYIAVLHVTLQMRPGDVDRDDHVKVLLEQICILLVSRFAVEDLELRWKADEKVDLELSPHDDDADQFIFLDQVKNKCKRPDIASQAHLTPNSTTGTL